jgi:hypothetical protein
MAITQGRYIGSDAAFKSRKSKSLSSSMRLGSQRKDSLEKKAIDDKRDQEQAKTKEISRREKERQSMRSDLEKRVSEETSPNRNTDERRKVVNVGRPDTAKNPMDPRAKLVKQAEIKNKIIEDQEKSMSMQKYHNLSDDLVAAVRAVLEGKNPFADKDDKKSKAKKDDDDADDKDTKSKKDDSDDDDADDKDTKSSKKDDGDDDDTDRQVGKSGKKTKVDVNPTMKMANEELKGGQKKLDKNHNGKLDKQDFKMLRKEEVELDEAMKFDRQHSPMPKMNQPSLKAHKDAEAWHAGHYEQATNREEKAFHRERMQHHNGQAAAMKGMGIKEETEQLDEFGGAYSKPARVPQRMIQPKAAERMANIADKKKMSHDNVQSVLFNQGHGRKSERLIKSLRKEDVSLSDEETARIEAKLQESDDKAYKYRDTDPADKNNDYDPNKDKNPEHIVVQLRKAKSLGAANRPIHFHDGSKVKVASGHVQKALDMHGSFKKAPDKDEFTQKLQASHASFKKAIGEG